MISDIVSKSASLNSGSSLSSTTTTKTASTSDESSSTTTTGSTDEFSNFMLEALGVTSADSVSEEELFAGLIGQRISAADKDDALEAYQTQFSTLKTSSTRSDGYVPFEDIANQALQNVVEKGFLTSDEAAKVKGEAFTAAQLDSTTDSLYDDRGGTGDPTIAVSQMESALVQMKTVVEKIDSGELTVDPISIEKESTGASAISSGSSSSSSSSGSSVSIDGAGGFVWKPVSESNGKLAVLIPSEYQDTVDHLEVCSSDGTVLESANVTKYYEDGRPIFRLSKTGASYGSDLSVVAVMKDGSEESWSISDGSVRHD